jgi:hypothetical protein
VLRSEVTGRCRAYRPWRKRVVRVFAREAIASSRAGRRRGRTVNSPAVPSPEQEAVLAGIRAADMSRRHAPEDGAIILFNDGKQSALADAKLKILRDYSELRRRCYCGDGPFSRSYSIRPGLPLRKSTCSMPSSARFKAVR